MAAINVRSTKLGSATIVRDVRIGGDLVVEGVFTGGPTSFVNLTVTGTLTASTANITTATITTATITTLNATTATIGTLGATTATITNLTVSNNLTLGGVAANRWVWVPSVGTRSGVGLASGNVASATDSLAWGPNCTVSSGAVNSLSIGQGSVCNATTATNGEQFSMGFFCTTNGRGSMAVGRTCSAVSISSYAMGESCSVGTLASNSFAMGNMCTVANNFSNSVALGKEANVLHSNSYVWGCGANNIYSTSGATTNTRSQASLSYTISATGGAFFALGGTGLTVDGILVPCDESLKEDISNFNTTALNAINTVPIKRYKRKLNANMPEEDRQKWSKYEIGFLLSDLPAILKSGPGDSSVNTISCIGVIFKALQEIRAFQLNLRQDVDSLLDALP